MTNKEVISVLSKRPNDQFGFVYTEKTGREILVCPAKIQTRYVVEDSPFYSLEDANIELRNVKSLHRINHDVSNAVVETVTVACE